MLRENVVYLMEVRQCSTATAVQTAAVTTAGSPVAWLNKQLEDPDGGMRENSVP